MTRSRATAAPPSSRASFCLILAVSAIAIGCTGTRTLRLDSRKYPPRPSIFPIEVFVGQVAQQYREIAIIESTAYEFDDEATRVRQIEQMKRKARRLGADAIQDLRILNKEIEGFTADERTPFPSVKQGEYALYFMRGTAIIYASSLPGAVAEGRGFDLNEELLPPPEEAEAEPSQEDPQ